MKLTGSAFVVIAVIGQELLAAAHVAPATAVLEAALRIGTCSLKLRGSVFSALSSAHWAAGQIDKAIACMQQDLAVAKSLGEFLYVMLMYLIEKKWIGWMSFYTQSERVLSKRKMDIMPSLKNAISMQKPW